MSRDFSRRLAAPLGALAVVCFFLFLVVSVRGAVSPQQAFLDEAPAPISEQSYTGTDRCVECHRPQVQTWAKTKHAQSYSTLPAKYQQDASCLKCHVTAYGESGGYVAGTDKDLVEVGCESCHGPGALHENAALRFRFSTTTEEEKKLEKELKATIVRTPTESVCASCHITQGHETHPAYEGQQTSPVASSASVVPCKLTSTAYPVFRGYNIKTCGSCHYGQYRQWRMGSHATLSADLPSKYVSDQACLTCHVKGSGVAAIFRTVAQPAENGGGAEANYVDAACESCHGPGQKHVRFNVQYIGRPPLGAELEQAARQSIRELKPANTCLQCHVRHSHKEHVSYEAEGQKKG